MKSLHTIFCTGILCLGFVSTAHSALIANGDFTTDSDTNLDWLDHSFTLGLSFDYVTSQLGIGGQFEGYQVATVDQAKIYLTNAGWVGAFDPSNEMNVGFVSALQSLTTDSLYNDPAGDLGILGLLDDPAGDLGGFTNDPIGELGFLDDPLGDLEGFTHYYSNTNIDTSTGEIGTSTFLVRSSVVPVPSAVWLFGSGLIGLVGLAKRKA